MSLLLWFRAFVYEEMLCSVCIFCRVYLFSMFGTSQNSEIVYLTNVQFKQINTLAITHVCIWQFEKTRHCEAIMVRCMEPHHLVSSLPPRCQMRRKCPVTSQTLRTRPPQMVRPSWGRIFPDHSSQHT